MVEFTIFVIVSLEVEFSTKLGSISFGDVISVGMEQFSVFLTVFKFPFDIKSRVSNPLSSVVSALLSIVFAFVLIILEIFSINGVD